MRFDTARIHRAGARRWSVAVAVALALPVLVVPEGGAGATAAGTAATTRVVRVYPFTKSGHLKAGYRVAGTVKGSCWTTSIAVSDAYRCFSGNDISDPCFAPPGANPHRLACLVVPWGKVTWLHLTKPLPSVVEHATSSSWVPWAQRLSNGVGCANAEGAVDPIDGKSLFYYCRPGQGWAGPPTRQHEPWTTWYATSSSAKHLDRETVLVAWF